MPSAAPLILALFLGAGLGVVSADRAVRAGLSFDTVAIGPWIARPRAGAMNADPYSRAALARSGEIAMGPGEGLILIAATDSEGRALDGACAYAVSGDAPPARHWTLSAYDPAGRLFDTPLGRNGFTSSEPARDKDGKFRILVAAAPQPGDWLPIGAGGTFRLALRLYDTPVGSAASALSPAQAPAILRLDCR